MFSTERVIKILAEVSKKYPSKTEEIAEIFVNFLKDNKEMYKLSEIVGLLEREEKRQKDKNVLHIVLSDLVPQKVIRKIKKFVGTSEEIDINVKIDKNIKGGFVVHYQDTIFDASIKNQFMKLKNTLK